MLNRGFQNHAVNMLLGNLGICIIKCFAYSGEVKFLFVHKKLKCFEDRNCYRAGYKEKNQKAN